MKTQNLSKTERKVKFNELTNKTKRKVYKEISKRYNGNDISKNIKFNFNRDIPKMAVSFFEAHPNLFLMSYNIEIIL